MDFLDRLTEPQLCNEEFFRGLTIEREVGSGAFGKAQLARDTSGTTYIIKQLKISLLVSIDYNMDRLRDEIMNHFAISIAGCPYICQIVCVNRGDMYINIVQEYCGRELQDLLEHHTGYTEADALKWTEQLLIALKCIHSLDLAHFDIKPQNLLIDDAGNLKIIDFGLSQHKSVYSLGLIKNLGGTPGYIPRQALVNKRFDYRNDSYAAGITISKLWPSIMKQTPPHIKELVRVLTEDYDTIPTMEVALNMLNPIKYPIISKLQPSLKYGILKFEEAVESAIEDDIQLGIIDPDTSDMEEERRQTRKSIYKSLLDHKIDISPEIVQKYPDVLLD